MNSIARPPQHSVARQTGRVVAWLVVVAALLPVLIWWWSLPSSPGAFYLAPASVPARPGALLRVETFSRQVPANARGWRILYTTTHADGSPALSSAIVLAPASAPPGPRPVVAWTHGTTGVASGCAPSLFEQPFASVPALDLAIGKGWVVVATDYTGLGTAGLHPFLVGQEEARSAIDAVRAARSVPGLALSADVVFWGHSQGGHAALWAGMLAPTYAPSLQLAGVAAMAPASDLQALIRPAQHTPVGKIFSSYVVAAYVASYPELRFEEIVRPGARVLAGDMARRCMAGLRVLPSVGEAYLLRSPIFAGDPTVGAFGARLAQNSPEGSIAAPVFISQGLSDDLVLPDVQLAFVRRRCAAQQSLRYQGYAGRDHMSLVAPDSPLVPELVRWTEQRFQRTPAAAGCEGVPH